MEAYEVDAESGKAERGDGSKEQHALKGKQADAAPAVIPSQTQQAADEDPVGVAGGRIGVGRQSGCGGLAKLGLGRQSRAAQRNAFSTLLSGRFPENTAVWLGFRVSQVCRRKYR